MVHVQKLRQELKTNHLDGLLVSSAYNIAYLTSFFDFSKTEREGYTLVTEKNVYIFASGLNSHAVIKHIGEKKDIILVEISPRAPLTKKVLKDVIQDEKIKVLGFEKHHLSFAEYERLKKDLVVKLVATEYLIEKLRMIKTPEEIAAIEAACKLGDKTFTYILTKIRFGITEKELALELEMFIRKQGAQLSFPTIVAFGENSAIPHHVTNETKLTKNQWVLLDFGAIVNNFCSDMTRTVFFGNVNNDQKRMYESVLKSQNEAFGYIANTSHPSAAKADIVARDCIVSHDFPTIPHSLGHGIGLEVHEPPSLSMKSKTTLQTNMVFSIEPGIYLPEIGGVRIEDLCVLDQKGPRYLTNANRNLIEIDK